MAPAFNVCTPKRTRVVHIGYSGMSYYVVVYMWWTDGLHLHLGDVETSPWTRLYVCVLHFQLLLLLSAVAPVEIELNCLSGVLSLSCDCCFQWLRWLQGILLEQNAQSCGSILIVVKERQHKMPFVRTARNCSCTPVEQVIYVLTSKLLIRPFGQLNTHRKMGKLLLE